MASASAFVTCIDTAIHDLEFLKKGTAYDVILNLVFWLRKLKTFVLCARKLPDDTSLGSFLTRIEDTIREWAEEIHLQRSESDLDPDGGESLIIILDNKIQSEFESLEEEVDKWYVTLLDHSQNSTSLILTADALLEIILCIVDGLVRDYIDFLQRDINVKYMGSDFKYWDINILKEEIEAWTEQLRFLSCLIWLATQASVEPPQDFLAHSQIVAFHAASFFSALRLNLSTCDWVYKESPWEIKLKMSTLVQKIKPIDPRVCETYIQVLSGSEVLRGLLPSTQDMDDKVTSARVFLLNTLISNLWEILLPFDTCVVDQLKELYGGLRSLRHILKHHPNKLDLKIGAVLCDAAVFIWPFYQTNPEVDLGLRGCLQTIKNILAVLISPFYRTNTEVDLQDLLQTIKNILAEASEQDPQIPKFDFPGTDELGFLDLLLEKLMAFTTSKPEQIAKIDVEIIQEELVFLRPFAGEIVELCSGQEEFQALWDRVLAVANKIESLIDPPVVGDLPDSFSTSFDSVLKDIMEIKAAVLNTFYGKSQEIDQVEEATSTSNHMPSQKPPSTVNEVVGFDDEARSTTERLTRGSRSLRIIAIVGMAGSGKTTFARKVFNDPSVMHHFQVRAWCTISQTLNRKKVLLDLLNEIHPMSHHTDEEDLAEKLRRSLKGRRYLIFLDDVWEIDAWNKLTMGGCLFPDDAVGSRIILTSRSHNAAPCRMLDQEPHFLRQLGKEESLELLQKKLLPQNQNDWPLDILVQIAEVCKGLPLTIVVVAGLLATTEPGGWKEILDDLSSGHGSVTDRCKNTLELSYKILPSDLRSYLLYLGAFEEDQEVSVRKLFRLWIAEGFVHKTEVKNHEDAAEDCLKDLIGRSLIMVASQRSDGGVKTCRIHDLIHDFCVEKAKNEHFFHFLRGQDELFAFSEPSNLRRLSIRSEAEDFKRSQLFCPGAHSLLFNCSPNAWESDEEQEEWQNISFVIQVFKLLRVLDLQSIYLFNGFPDEIVLLVQLAFLAIGGNIKHIPSSIARLTNLETLILNAGRLSLPGSLFNLQKLQYIYCPSYHGAGGGILSNESLDSSTISYELDTFSGAVIPSAEVGRLFKKFPKLRRFKCKLVDYEDIVDFQSRLESLHIMYHRRWGNIPEFIFPNTLKKLSLSELTLSLKNISVIGQLPSLEVLKFFRMSFEQNTLEMKEGEFSKPKYVKIDSVKGFKWTACDDQFDCLQKLVMNYVHSLEEIPSCLESLSTLEEIDIYYCDRGVIEMVKQIEEQQEMFDNSSLKINIVG